MNLYDDEARADSYAEVGFEGTYHLASRDLPALLAAHVKGNSALDLGCGAGRSTRLLTRLGFSCVGVDISAAMLERARRADPEGDYRLVPDGDLSSLGERRFDLVLAMFPLDNVATVERKGAFLAAARGRLAPRGRFVCVVSSPELYLHDWLSFTTRQFPGNRTARDVETVRIVMLDGPDRRPIEDTLCTDATYRALFAQAGLTLLETARPRGLPTDPYPWVSEERVAPWTIYVLGPR